MKREEMTMEQVLRMIKQERGMRALRSQEQLIGLFADFSRNQLRPQANALKVFLACRGNERILSLGNVSQQARQVEFHRLAREMVTEHNMQEETAVEICSTFWRVALEAAPPEYTLRQSSSVPVPQPVQTAEELYRQGRNCAAPAEAVQWYQKAAAQGHLEAMLHLGFAYEYGKGVEKAPQKAVKWFRQAAEQGYAPAQDRMAYCYDKGFGVEQNLDKAIWWCQKACAQDFPGSARHLRQLELKRHKTQPKPNPGGPTPEYEIVSNVLVRYNGTAARVEVPSGVRRIGVRAFAGNKSIQTVILPEGVIGISADAFLGCPKLKEVTIPGSVIAVNLDCFAECRKLRRLTLQSGVQKLLLGHKLDRFGSVNIVLPDTVTSVTWSPMPDEQRKERMKHPKGLAASNHWLSLLQDFFKKNPDFRPGPVRRFRRKHFFSLVLAAVMLLCAVSFAAGRSEDKRTRRDLAPFQLEESAEDMLLAGTDAIYTYPDDSRMEFYYDDSGNEIYRVYVNKENEIENLFAAKYDSYGRLVMHLSHDGQGNLLRSDSYDFHSSEDTAQRRVTLGDGRYFQGVSTFDENGYETFTVTHEDGTQTVSEFKDGGVLTFRVLLDAEGNGPDVMYGGDPVNFEIYDWENELKVYGPWQTVMGWINTNGYVCSYVQGLCGGALKEYSVSEEAAFIDTYDPMGNLLEMLQYRDGQMEELAVHEVHSYDSNGIYTGYTGTYYHGDGDYWISNYDAKGIELTSESHYTNAEGEVVVSYERYETELDDQGRVIRVQTFDGESGRLSSIDETEYDAQGNVQKSIFTYFYDDGGYSISIYDGDGKDLGYNTYYPSGKIESVSEYNSEGKQTKRTRYYESGQVERVTEYNDAGDTISRISYYENGQTEYLEEYDAQGNPTKSTWYYENGQIRSLEVYNDQGNLVKRISYYENGNTRSIEERNSQGEITKSIYYYENGTIIE